MIIAMIRYVIMQKKLTNTYYLFFRIKIVTVIAFVSLLLVHIWEI